MLLAVTVHAKEGTGSCMTGNGYVQATAYVSVSGNNFSGNIVLSNANTTSALLTAQLTVTVYYEYKHTETKTGYDQYGNIKTQDVTTTQNGSCKILDMPWHGNVAREQSTNVDIPSVRIPESKYSVNHSFVITDIQVSVSNPVCE